MQHPKKTHLPFLPCSSLFRPRLSPACCLTLLFPSSSSFPSLRLRLPPTPASQEMGFLRRCERRALARSRVVSPPASLRPSLSFSLASSAKVNSVSCSFSPPPPLQSTSFSLLYQRERKRERERERKTRV